MHIITIRIFKGIFEILTTDYGFPFWLINEDNLKQMVDEALDEWYKELLGE